LFYEEGFVSAWKKLSEGYWRFADSGFGFGFGSKKDRCLAIV
jgi:hypothetical protein